MRKVLGKTVKAFSRNERGATMIEYAIVVGFIALVVIVGVTAFGVELNDAFTRITATTGTIPN